MEHEVKCSFLNYAPKEHRGAFYFPHSDWLKYLAKESPCSEQRAAP